VRPQISLSDTYIITMYSKCLFQTARQAHSGSELTYSPKIQPVEDPNPEILETRHRIFSIADGKWHEVIGDAAAIRILGEEAFYGGQKETRRKRAAALPGLTPPEPVDGDADGTAGRRIIEREGVMGGEMGPWRSLGSSHGVVHDRMQWEEDDGVRTLGIAL
jgi:hypothetical protein